MLQHDHKPSERKTESRLGSASQDHNSVSRPSRQPLMMASAQPRPGTLAPETVMALQRTHGNQYVQRLIQGTRLRTGRLQRVITETPAVYKTPDELSDMTLAEFYEYTQSQIDWPKGIVHEEERDDYLRLLDLATGKHVLSVLGQTLIGELLEFDSRFYVYLKVYAAGAGGDPNSISVSLEDDIERAIHLGRAMEQIQTSLGEDVAHKFVKNPLLRKLAPPNLSDWQHLYDFLAYFKPLDEKSAPNLESEKDIESFQKYKGVPLKVHYAASLKGKIKNVHRFTKGALDKLIKNFDKPDNTKKPLTLIIHSSSDPSGVFHHDEKLTEVITNESNFTLMLEVITSLNDIQSQLPALAKKYGKNGKIDQVLFAGHGQSHSLTMTPDVKKGDEPKEAPPAADKSDDDSEGPDVKPQKLYNNADDAQEADDDVKPQKLYNDADETSGFDKSDDAAKEPEEEPLLNLASFPPEKRDATGKFFRELIKHMANDPSTSMYRRIVFNACLANANQVVPPDNWPKDLAEQQAAVRKSITDHPGLATYLRSHIPGDTIHVLAPNGSIPKARLIDDGGGLQISIEIDPEITNTNKNAYVEKGFDPQGVFFAVLDGWSGAGAKSGQEESHRQACFDAMTKRIALGDSPVLSEAIIRAIFRLMQRHWKDGAALQKLTEVGTYLWILQQPQACSVSILKTAELLPDNQFGDDAEILFKSLAKTQRWKDSKEMRLVVEQVWMLHDPAHEAAMMDALSQFDSKTLEEYLDTECLEPRVERLLAGPHPDAARQLLAYKFPEIPAAQVCLRKTLSQETPGDSNKVVDQYEVKSLLKDADKVEETQNQKANLGLKNNGRNDIFMESPSWVVGQVKSNQAVVYLKEDLTQQSEDAPLPEGTEVYVLGQKKLPTNPAQPQGEAVISYAIWNDKQVMFVNSKDVVKS